MTRSWKQLLKSKNFIYIWLSQILSQITINILNYSILFTLFEKTGSTIATSLVWISYAIPAVFIGPFASTLVDMSDRKKILIISNLLQSLTIFFYSIGSGASYFTVYAIVMIYSSLNQFYVPAEYAALPYIAGKKSLPEANALFLITQQGSLIFGFGVAGIFLKLVGFENTLIICSLMMFLAFITTTFLPRMVTKKRIPARLDKAVISFFQNIFSGYDFIKSNKLVLATFILMISLQIFLTIVIVNVPALATDILKIPINLAGSMLIVPGGIGAMTASFLVPRFLSKGMRKINLIKKSLLVLSISLFMLIFIFSYFDLLYKIMFSFSSMTVIGFSYIGIIIPAQTFLQQKTPFGFRGRVFGNYWFLVTVLSVFPVIVSGTVTEIFGIKVLIAVLLIGLLGLLWFLTAREKQYLLPKNYM